MKHTLFAVSALVLFATASMAEDVKNQKVVSFGDLNLSAPQDVATFQQRLLAAAAEVCATPNKPQPTNDAEYEACKKKAVQNAVADVVNKMSFRLSAIR